MLVRMRPEVTPIGLHLTSTSRLVARAFDDALAEAGGSLPVWLVLLHLTINRDANQRRLAQAVGVTQATLTHHLGSMEKAGLIARSRDPSNRRNHVIKLTSQGEAKFLTLAAAARDFDARLRGNMSAADLETLRTLLDRLSAGFRPS
jgi:MarR family transcriptional regulator for hemolysin